MQQIQANQDRQLSKIDKGRMRFKELHRKGTGSLSQLPRYPNETLLTSKKIVSVKEFMPQKSAFASPEKKVSLFPVITSVPPQQTFFTTQGNA